MEQQVISAFREANFVALLEIEATEIISRTREEPVAIWNPRTQQSEESTRVVRERLLMADFTTLRKFKGDPSAKKLETPADSASCGVSLKPGSRYLVYAYGPDDDGLISTSLCMRTSLAEASEKDIEILNAATRPVSVVVQLTGAERRFNDAMDLIHSYPDDNEKLAQVMTMAEDFARSDPFSGFSQTLQAEIQSIWLLASNGEPLEQQKEVLALLDEALRMNPKLAEAHVARARTHASASRRVEAETEIQAALQIRPQLPTAFFVQAEIYRRANNSSKAEEWMRAFISAVKDPVQQANGYQWMGDMSRDHAFHPQSVNREMNLLMARTYYQRSVELDPNDPGALITFAAFLNDLPGDFASAEKYANQALALEETSNARFQLAAARYQRLQAQGASVDAQSLRDSTANIAAETGVSLEEALQDGGFRPAIYARLTRLQIRVEPPAR